MQDIHRKIMRSLILNIINNIDVIIMGAPYIPKFKIWGPHGINHFIMRARWDVGKNQLVRVKPYKISIFNLYGIANNFVVSFVCVIWWSRYDCQW